MYDIFERLCKERGITAYRVSKDTGISSATLSDWKTGKSHPKADKIRILADYFGVSPEYIATGVEETQHHEYYTDPETARRAQEAFDDPNLRVLFDAADGARPEDIQMAANLLKRLNGTNLDG